MDTIRCTECRGEAWFLGYLGNVAYYRCRQCGWNQTVVEEPHKVSEPSTEEGVLASDNRVIREGYLKSKEGVCPKKA